MLASLAKKVGLRPCLAPESTIPKILATAALTFGPFSLLGASPAQAAAYQCAPTTTGGLFNISFASLARTDTVICGDKKYTINDFNFGGSAGDIDFAWIIVDPPAGYARDQFVTSIDFTSLAVGPVSGFIDYSVEILSPDYTFADVQLDSSVTVDNDDANQTSVVKTVTGAPTSTSFDGSKIPAVNFLSPLTSITVRDTWNVQSADTLTNITDTLRQRNDVPGPLPVLGAGLAFGFSRRLRSRIKAGARARGKA